jgi:adenosylcobinamide-GDP ribazoletransferase
MAEDKKTDQATPKESDKKPIARKKAAPRKATPKKPVRSNATKGTTATKKAAAKKPVTPKKHTKQKSSKTKESVSASEQSKQSKTPKSAASKITNDKSKNIETKTTALKAGSFGKASVSTASTTVQLVTTENDDVDQPSSPLPENRLTMPEENALLEKEETTGHSEENSDQTNRFNPFIIVEDIAAAMMLLTRIPVPWRKISNKPPNLSRSAWAYPLVGLIISLIGAFVYAVAANLNLSPMLAALLAVLAMVLTTGAFHEDGLADMADGIGGGMTKDKKLEIMRDSRVGTYGAVALILSIMIRVETLDIFSYMAAILAIVAAGPLSRAMIVLALYLLPPAREKGLGTVAGEPPQAAMIAALVFGIIPLALLWSPLSILLATIASILALILVSRIAMKSIDGYTGDILGAIQQVSEAAIMIALLIAYKNIL